MWSVSTIITGLISFMVETAPTLGSIETSTNQKKKYAKLSLDYNVKDKTFSKLFPELVALQNERVEERIRLHGESGANRMLEEVTKLRSLAENDAGGLQGIMAVGAGFVALISILFAIRFL